MKNYIERLVEEVESGSCLGAGNVPVLKERASELDLEALSERLGKVFDKLPVLDRAGLSWEKVIEEIEDKTLLCPAAAIKDAQPLFVCGRTRPFVSDSKRFTPSSILFGGDVTPYLIQNSPFNGSNWGRVVKETSYLDELERAKTQHTRLMSLEELRLIWERSGVTQTSFPFYYSEGVDASSGFVRFATGGPAPNRSNCLLRFHASLLYKSNNLVNVATQSRVAFAPHCFKVRFRGF